MAAMVRSASSTVTLPNTPQASRTWAGTGAGAHADQSPGAVRIGGSLGQRPPQLMLNDVEPPGERRAGGVVLFVPLQPVPRHEGSASAR